MKRVPMIISGVDIGRTCPVRIMGIINLSPESFYQESIVKNEEELKVRIQTLEKQGASIIDIGGASTAPANIYGTSSISEKQEVERVTGAMESIVNFTKLPISVDTTSSKVADVALSLGASLVNDISGLRGDSEMASLLADREVPVVLMAYCQDGCLSVDASYSSLKESIMIAKEAGIEENALILDPGIGFGKPPEVDFSIIKELRRFSLLGSPLLLGISRKAFIGALLGEPNPERRLIGSIAATAIAVRNGADIIRTHDVPEAYVAARIGEALRNDRIYDKGIEVMRLSDVKDVEQVLEDVGVGEDIRYALSEKGVMVQILLDEVSVPAALIIKQEMLSLGGDAAYHHDTIDYGVDKTSVLIMGTKKQVTRFAKKASKMDYFGLNEIGVGVQRVLTR